MDAQLQLLNLHPKCFQCCRGSFETLHTAYAPAHNMAALDEPAVVELGSQGRMTMADIAAYQSICQCKALPPDDSLKWGCCQAHVVEAARESAGRLAAVRCSCCLLLEHSFKRYIHYTPLLPAVQVVDDCLALDNLQVCLSLLAQGVEHSCICLSGVLSEPCSCASFHVPMMHAQC